MKKILILTAGFGEGHNAAARNLRDALELVSDEVKVELLDLFESSYGAFNMLAKKTCLGMVQYAPSIWGGIYSLLDNSKFVENRLGTDDTRKPPDLSSRFSLGPGNVADASGRPHRK